MERFSIKRGFGLCSVKGGRNQKACHDSTILAGSYPINRRGTLARLGKRSVCCYNLPSVTNPTQPTTRKRGRPRLGDWRLEITLPATVKHELLRREEATGLYRSLGLFFIRTSTLAYADHVVFFKHQPAAIHIDLAFPDDPARRWHA
jgi:hypothetical protein